MLAAASAASAMGARAAPVAGRVLSGSAGFGAGFGDGCVVGVPGGVGPGGLVVGGGAVVGGGTGSV